MTADVPNRTEDQDVVEKWLRELRQAYRDGQRAAKHAFGGLKALLRRQHEALKFGRPYK